MTARGRAKRSEQALWWAAVAFMVLCGFVIVAADQVGSHAFRSVYAALNFWGSRALLVLFFLLVGIYFKQKATRLAEQNDALMGELEARAAASEQRAKELETLCNVSRALTSQLHTQMIYDEVVQAALQVSNQLGSIVISVNKKGGMTIRAAAGVGAHIKEGLGDSITRVLVPDAVLHGGATAISFSGDSTDVVPLPLPVGVMHAYAVPLIWRDEVRGAIVLLSADEDEFDTETVEVLTILARHSAAALENAQLYETTDWELRKTVGKLQALLDVSAAVSSTLDVMDLVHITLTKAQQMVGAEASSLALLNDDGETMHVDLALGPSRSDLMGLDVPKGTGIVGWVAQEGKPVVVDSAMEDGRFNPEVDRAADHVTRSVLCVPLTLRDRTVGAVEVLNKRGDVPFTKDDQDLLTAFANHAALAIENALLYAETKEFARRAASAIWPKALSGRKAAETKPSKAATA